MATQNIILTVGDTLNVTAQAATAPNKLPLVNVGIDQSIKLPISEVTLTGIVSDSDGTVVSQQWTKVSGGLGTIVSPTALTTKVTGLALGNYMFRLTAKDDKGGTTSDDLNVTVLPADVVIPPSTKVNYLQLPTYTGGNTANSDQVVSRMRITNPNGVAMNLVGKRNIKFIECYFDFANEEAISFERSTGLDVSFCLFSNMNCGVYGLDSTIIKVYKNQFINTRMRPTGGRGQFVQFNNCGGAGCLIEDNKGENWLGESNPEDLISMYQSNGVAGSPISIRKNMFRGGGPSSSGGGIMTGDYGGSWQVVDGNTLLDPGQYGIAAAGGYNIQLIYNKIYARQQYFTNNPLYVWGQKGAVGGDIIVKGNRVNWTDRNGDKNNGWNAGNLSNVSFEAPTTITLAEMNVPAHLIDMVTPAELLQIRNK